jgi:hypothetical protein
VAQVSAASEDATQHSRTAPDFFDLDQRMMEDLNKGLIGDDLGICRQLGDVGSVAKSLRLQEILEGHATLA